MIVLQIVQQFCIFCCFLKGMQEKKNRIFVILRRGTKKQQRKHNFFYNEIVFSLFYEGVQKK